MPYTIRIRRDNYTNLSTVTLGVGEIAYDTTNNQLRIGNGSTVFSGLTAIGGGAGGLTSVGLSLPNIFTVSNSPLTANGTITATLATQTVNKVFAGPTTGAAAAPTFRALVAGDIPDISATYQAADATLASLAGLTIAADSLPYGTGSDTFGTTTLTAFGRSLIDDADAAASRSTLGLGAISVGSTANTFDAIDWDTSPTAAIQTARLQWDTTDSTLQLGMDSNVNCKIGQGLYKNCRNSTASTITKGTVVFVKGSHASSTLTIEPAQANTEATSATTIGIAAEDILTTTTGFVQVFGLLTGISTSGFSTNTDEGKAVYLSESTAGGLRLGLPTQPNHGVRVGFLVKSAGSGAGSVFVNVQNYQELEELSDVYIPTTPAGNDMLVWDSGDSRWENRTTAQVLSNIGAAASSHTHGTISNDGKIGSDAGRVIVTTTNGALQALTDGSPNYVLSTNGSGTLSWVAQSGGGGTPGGTDTQVQFNDGGSTFGGDAGFTYVKATDALTVAGSVTTGEVIVTNQGLLKLNEGTGGGTNYVGLKSPSTLANNNEYTFPNAVGAAGKMLGIDTVSTNNATLKWATVNDVYSLFTPLMAVAPASNYATLDIQNDIFVLDFDQGTSESVIFQGVLPNNADLTNGLYIKIYWTAAWTTSASTVEWKIELANLEIGTVMSKAYDTATVISKTYGTTTTLTVGLSETTVAVADTDGLGAGDPYQLKITRNTAGTDDMGTDAMLIAVEVSRA